MSANTLFKTFTNALLQRVKSFRGNWDQNDPTADDYIANRPFYSNDPVETVFLKEVTCGPNDWEKTLTRPFTEGETYIVTWDGVEFECVAKEYYGYIMLGNNAIYEYDEGVETDTGEPFAVEHEVGYTDCFFYLIDEGTHTVSIKQRTIEVHEIDELYLPENVKKQADWNENDATSGAYIKNRPLYMDLGPAPVADILTIEFTATATDDGYGNVIYAADISQYFSTVDRIVTTALGDYGPYGDAPKFYSFDGVEHSLVVSDYNDWGVSYSRAYGNASLRSVDKEDNGEPMYASFYSPADYNHYAKIYVADNKPHTISFYVYDYVAHKLDEKYIPDTIATKAYVDQMLGVIENGTY